MRTSRQVRNRQLRDMGIVPESYHYRLVVGDRIVARIVEQEPPADVTYQGIVRRVVDHGHYARALLWVPAQRRDVELTLYRDGPADWGVVECRLVRRIREPLEPSRGNW